MENVKGGREEKRERGNVKGVKEERRERENVKGGKEVRRDWNGGKEVRGEVMEGREEKEEVRRNGREGAWRGNGRNGVREDEMEKSNLQDSVYWVGLEPLMPMLETFVSHVSAMK